MIITLRLIQGKTTGGMETGDGGCHAEREIISQRVSGAGPTGWSDPCCLEEYLERIPACLGPEPIVHAEQHDWTVVVHLARATFGQHGHKGMGDRLRPFAGGLNSLENESEQVQRLNGKALKVRIRPTVPARGLGWRRRLDHLFEGCPSKPTNRRESREPIQGGQPLVGMELASSRGPQVPPPSINFSKKGSLAWLGRAGANGREGDGGRALPDVTVYPGRLGRVVTPLMPSVTPVLAMSCNASGDFHFCFNKEGVKLGLGGERDEARSPSGGEGLRAD